MQLKSGSVKDLPSFLDYFSNLMQSSFGIVMHWSLGWINWYFVMALVLICIAMLIVWSKISYKYNYFWKYKLREFLEKVKGR